MSLLRRLFSVVLMALVLAGIGSAGLTTKAYAAQDSIDSWTASFVVDKSGAVHVKETLVYRFGSSSGRHGIDRKLLVREPWDSQQDAVYDVTKVKVTSPDASSDVSLIRQGSGRERFLTIRIGNANRTVSTPTATYVISYDVYGALRSFGDYDEFYWDAVGDLTPLVRNIDLTVQVPGGVQEVSCFSGRAKSTQQCTSANVDGQQGRYQEASKSADELVTIGAKITSGLVSDPKPILQPKADSVFGSPQGVQVSPLAVGGATGLAAVLTGLFGWLVVRNRRDYRFAGVAPGTIPPNPESAPVVRDDAKTTIPVRFNPPDMPVAFAGYLKDGSFDVEETSATLVDLAVKGAIQLRMDDTGGSFSKRKTVYVRPVDLRRAQFGYERALLDRIFRGQNVEVALSGYGDLENAHEALKQSIKREVDAQGLIRNASSGPGSGAFGGLGFFARRLVPFVIIGLGWAGTHFRSILPGGLWLLPVVVILVGIQWVRRRTRKGTRSATGRALTDQIEGFREYIATAEADQLRFEEGVDIFSRYLPWAIMFGLAERWTKVCKDLVAMGRLSPQTPYWYYGNDFAFDYFRWSIFSDVMSHAAISEPVSSGSGFGGGSSFGGGGFSGGGGGGGGASSW